MDNETKLQIKEAYAKLPKDLQEAVVSVNWQNEVTRIAQKFELDGDKAESLQNETLFVMMGLELSKDFVENLQRHLNVTSTQASLISANVNESVFRPMRASLQKIEQEAEEEERKEKMTEDEDEEETETVDKEKTNLNEYGYPIKIDKKPTFNEMVDKSKQEKDADFSAKQKEEEERKMAEEQKKTEVSAEVGKIQTEISKLDEEIIRLENSSRSVLEDVSKTLTRPEELVSAEKDLESMRIMAKNELISEEGRKRTEEMFKEREGELKSLQIAFEATKNLKITEEKEKIAKRLQELRLEKQNLTIKKLELGGGMEIKKENPNLSNSQEKVMMNNLSEETETIKSSSENDSEEGLSREEVLRGIENPPVFQYNSFRPKPNQSGGKMAA